MSDTHVSADPEAAYRGQNADRNLRALLPAVRDWAPDLVLLTGDISEDASPAAYARVADLLARSGAPLLALPGNHDDPDVMQGFFPLGPWNGPFSRDADGWTLVLLDSTARGRISGSFSGDDLARLEECLQRSGARHVLVALHHQPVAVDAPWIDRYALEEPERFFESVDRDPRVRCIIWGHIHHDFRTERRGAELLGAPSATANSLPQTPRFTLDPDGPACRWLQLHHDGRVESGLLRPPGA